MNATLVDAGPPRRPIRELFSMLSGLDGEEALVSNLEALEDYQQLVGDAKPRFCEWVYHRLETRGLVAGLRILLRPSDIKRLAERLEITPKLATEAMLRRVLGKIGVFEPEPPRRVVDGVDSLRHFQASLDLALNGGEDPSLEAPSGPDEASGRRAGERLLKLIATFLWGAGLCDIFQQVSTQGLHEFKGSPINEWDSWVASKECDLGRLNHLLRAMSMEAQEREATPPFIRGRAEIWAEATFQKVGALANSLSDVAHDHGVPRETRWKRQFKAVCNVVGAIDADVIRVPRSIRFFLRYEDVHGVHYEGLDADGVRVKVFECDQALDLHADYIYLSATNPSAVDLVCVPLSARFLEPVV